MAGQFKADAACVWACGNRVPKAGTRKTARMCKGCTAFRRRYTAAKVYTPGPKATQPDREARIAAHTARAGVHLPLFDGRRSDAA